MIIKDSIQDVNYVGYSELKGYSNEFTNVKCIDSQYLLNEKPIKELIKVAVVANFINDWDVIGNIGLIEGEQEYSVVKIDYDESFRNIKSKVTLEDIMNSASFLLNNGCISKKNLLDTISIVSQLKDIEIKNMVKQGCNDIKKSFNDEYIISIWKEFFYHDSRKNFFENYLIQSPSNIDEICSALETSLFSRVNDYKNIYEELAIITDSGFKEAIKIYDEYYNICSVGL